MKTTKTNPAQIVSTRVPGERAVHQPSDSSVEPVESESRRGSVRHKLWEDALGFESRQCTQSSPAFRSRSHPSPEGPPARHPSYLPVTGTFPATPFLLHLVLLLLLLLLPDRRPRLVPPVPGRRLNPGGRYQTDRNEEYSLKDPPAPFISGRHPSRPLDAPLYRNDFPSADVSLESRRPLVHNYQPSRGEPPKVLLILPRISLPFCLKFYS